MSCGVDTRRAGWLQIQCGVYEHEQAQADAGAAQWPDEIWRRIGKEFSAWRARHPDRSVLCSRAFAVPGQCTLEIFHVHPSELAPPVMRRARSAPAATRAAPECPTCGDR